METSAYVLRFIVSPREYETIASKWQVGPRLPPTAVRASEERGRMPQALVRQHVRLFLKTYAVSKLAALAASTRWAGAARTIEPARLAGSVTLVSAGYQAVYRLLSRALVQKTSGSSQKETVQILVPIASAAVASLGFALFPDAARSYAALYTATKAAEYVYNYFDDKGYFSWKPRFLGSWILFPIALSQLFYTLIVTPELAPPSFTRLMLRLRGNYGPTKPAAYPSNEAWPTDTEWITSLADVARLRFPTFKSPIVYRHQKAWPSVLDPVVPVLNMANPSNTTFTGAILHPEDDSEWRTFFETVFTGYAATSKYLLPLYLVLGFLQNHRKLTGSLLLKSVGNTFRSATFISMSSACCWAGIGLSQTLLGKKMLSVSRFRIIGFLSGLWAFLDQVNGRTRNLYATRLAIMSQYNQWKARHGGRPPLCHGDILLFAVGLCTTFTVFNLQPGSISSPRLRQILQWVQTGNADDPAPLEELKHGSKHNKKHDSKEDLSDFAPEVARRQPGA